MQNFFIDYFSYGTDIFTDFISSEMLTMKKAKSSRFYNNVLDCERSTIQSEAKIKNLNTFSVRFKKDYINECLEDGLPTDCKIQRIDFAFDTESEEVAKSFVFLEFDYCVASKTGHTYYYGERKKELYERVYFLEERGFWRYELEYRPRYGRENKDFQKAHQDIRAIWHNVCGLFFLTGRTIRGTYEPITKARKQYIDIHFDSEFVPANYLFYVGLSDGEREYFDKRTKLWRVNDRALIWKKEIDRYKIFKRFLKDI